MRNYLVAIFGGLLFIAMIVVGVVQSHSQTQVRRTTTLQGKCGEGSGYVQMICRRKAGNLSRKAGKNGESSISDTERFINGYIVF